MEETVLYPSPNWFLPSVLAVSKDGWMIYGGPVTNLIVLEPLPQNSDRVLDWNHGYKTHVINKSHKQKVVSVAISPDWPERRHFVTGSFDGTVKEWAISQENNTWIIKNIHSHEVHANEKENVIGVGYSGSSHVISVGSFSYVVVWELNTNVTKTYNLMKSFRATCLSCSPHLPLVVAVGTKQGVIIVLDLNSSKGEIIYKVRGQDDEVGSLSWCPQYKVVVKRLLEPKKSVATQRLEQIRSNPDDTAITKSDPDTSAVSKTLPNDSFDDSGKDDMFDIYKDHEANEFGHKKYQPEDIVVKVKEESKDNDFLAECERLKAQILKNKQETEGSMADLVDAMDKAHIEDEKQTSEESSVSGSASLGASGSITAPLDGTVHVHKHLLASVSKNGFSIRILSKAGKIVASCNVSVHSKSMGRQVNKLPQHASLCWYKPDCLLIADGKTTLVQTDPLQIDCRNKLTWRIVHSAHRRGLYFVTTNAARVQSETEPQSESDWYIWTTAQDRYIIKYDMKAKKIVAKYATCAGYVYDIRPCPYDAGKVSIAVGDGAIRIWSTESSGQDDNKLAVGEITSYWQNVQGKILQCAWHPTKENLLAFATAESRIGIIDTSKPERGARLLQLALSGGIYSLAWGEDMTLFAVGGKELVMYQADKPEQSPIPIHIEIEGQKWDPCVVNYSPRGLAVASYLGGVALFSGPGGQALAAKFVFTRMIHAMEWHPQQVSSSDEVSPHKNLLAICSVDKCCNIVIIQYGDKEDGGKQFSDFVTLSGHTDIVYQIYWSPHLEGQLISTSADATVRVWDAVRGACVAVFAGHRTGSLGAAWCAQPQLAHTVLTGGSDYCVRLWDLTKHPAHLYKEAEPTKKKKQINKGNKVTSAKETHVDQEVKTKADIVQTEDKMKKDEDSDGEDMASDISSVIMSKPPKKYLMPNTSRQLSKLNIEGSRTLIYKYATQESKTKSIVDLFKENTDLYDLDFLKLFGTTNDVNEILDKECELHLEMKMFQPYAMLMIFRGHIDAVFQFAYSNDLLDPFLLSIAPCVSFKYWKDAMQLYIAQIDRVSVSPKPVNSDTDDKNKSDMVGTTKPSHEYGGAAFRKLASLLAVHDVRAAVAALERYGLYKEAYVLCRCRHMDSIADEILNKWVSVISYNGDLVLAALLYLVMGLQEEAATTLRRSTSPENLKLSAELATSAGLTVYADYLQTKAKTIEKPKTVDETEENLAELPTKIELLMREKPTTDTTESVDIELVKENPEVASTENGEKAMNETKL